MSLSTLESAILHEARSVLNNRKLRKMDIQEWSTSTIEQMPREVIVFCPEIGAYVSVLQEHDKRKKK